MHRDLVVVGVSAGGVEVLCALPTSAVRDGTPSKHGHVHIAPPDHRTVVENGVPRLSRSPGAREETVP